MANKTKYFLRQQKWEGEGYVRTRQSKSTIPLSSPPFAPILSPTHNIHNYAHHNQPFSTQQLLDELPALDEDLLHGEQGVLGDLRVGVAHERHQPLLDSVQLGERQN